VTAPKNDSLPPERELKVGIGALVETRTFDVPDGDAPPWDATTKFAVVGADVDRQDGIAKASGRAKYAYDITFPGLLQAVILRSKIARGKVATIDLEPARGMPGVAAVIGLKDAGKKVRFVGDEIAAVCAPTIDQCRDALERIVVTYEQEPHTVDFLQSSDAPVVDDSGELVDPWSEDGDLDKALAAATVAHTGTYRTEVQTHGSMETHGAVAKWSGDDLDLWMSTQATFGVRGEIAQAMRAADVKCTGVTIHAEFVGGGFGSKFTAGAEGRAVALLARAANAPVKLMLDRYEDHTCAGNRPAALMQFRAGLDQDGVITAWDQRTFGGCGHNGQGGGVAIPDHFLRKAARRKDRMHKDLATDADPGRPMRAPGHPQGFFGAELFLDELAAAAGLDPLVLRQKNDPQAIRQQQYTLGAERFGYAKARADAAANNAQKGVRILRGVGVASARWGNLGNDGRGRDGSGGHSALCRIHQDGSVEARSGAQDIGTGLKTVLAILTAEELGIRAEQVRATAGHTSDPSGPAAGGSTTTPSLAPAIRHAAFLCRQQLASKVADHLGVAATEVVFADGKIGTAAKSLTFADACKLIGPNPLEARGERFPNYKGDPFERGVCGLQFAEVEVDSWTGLVRVVRMLAIQDCGIVLAKKPAESQVLGAMIQGIGFALHEQRIMDRQSGRMLNGDFLRYKVPGAVDIPPMDVIMQSVANGHTNCSAAGLGEAPSCAAAASIANAVFHAASVPLRHLPITPDKVLKALSQRKAK
jgi:xanthine dehydrogenase YagR molybdenum-binding subunit